jgi:hypothetical protein
VNEEKGKEDVRGKNTRKKGTLGREHYFSYWETVLEHFYFLGRLEDCITGFWLEKIVVGLR